MTTTAGIWNNAQSQSMSTSAARPMDDSGGSSTSSSSTISSNDFLTLLVTEMQNQDPTSATDPNEYINQLVSVNSLEQLIQINQTLGTALTPTPSSSSTPSSALQGGLDTHLSGSAPSSNSNTSSDGLPRPVAVISGNLGVPAANPAALSVAEALSGRARPN
jgi:flagellar basal-body rod modification protein FlgD